MGIRMSGLASGLDTEAIIKELMTAQRTKQKKVTDKQTKLTWTQEKWKELNTKLYNFYRTELQDMSKQATFQAKKVSSSNDIKATATATLSAPKGTHELKIDRLASSQSITSSKLSRTDPSKGKVLSSTKLSDLGIGVGTEIFINGPDKTTTDENGRTKKIDNEVTFKVEAGTTVSDFISACGEAGLQATFDEGQQRIFISSKESGADQGFEIKTNVNGTADSFKVLLDIDSADAAKQAELTDALGVLSGYEMEKIQTVFDKLAQGDDTALAGEPQDLVDAVKLLKERTKEVSKANAEAQAEKEMKAERKEAYLNEQAMAAIGKPAGTTVDSLTSSELEQFKTKRGELSEGADPAAIEADFQAWKSSNSTEFNNRTQQMVEKQEEASLQSLNTLALNSAKGRTNELSKLGLDEMSFDSTGKIVASGTSGMTMVAATDAQIQLDGATLTGSSNHFKVNNITLDLKGTTGTDEKIMITIENDPDAAYQKVKDFVNKYNELLKEMNELYYAETSRGYDPLSDEEKDAMRDEEIDRWEKKIKDSLFRRDTVVSSITSSMRTAMQRTVNVNGKSYSLASIGIQTSMDYTEKGMLHILGDPDDTVYSGEDENKLKNMLESDPDVVMAILNDAGKTLYDDFTKKMSRIEGVRSAYTFYNDKEMEKLQRDYKKQVANWEKKLNEMEDRYYKQFTAMEKAMSQLQNQSNSLASMLGLGGN